MVKVDHPVSGAAVRGETAMAAQSVMRHRSGLLAAVIALVAAAALALAVTAFTADRTRSPSAGSVNGGGANGTAVPAATTAPPIPKVKVALDGLTKGIQSWSKPLRLHVSHGTLLTVTATDSSGTKIDGAITGTKWASATSLTPLRSYQIQAYVRGLDGVSAYHTLTVKTAPPNYTIATRVTIQRGAAVGVAFPITVIFTSPVADADRAAVEKALVVHTSTPVTGAWHWFSATEVHFRPQNYWPANSTITLHRDLAAVHMASGGWGTDQPDLNFTVGDSHISTVDIQTQRMTVTVNGKVVGVYKVSTGRPQYPTLGGVHTVLDKKPSVIMDSSTVGIPKFLPGTTKKNPAAYYETVLWDVRISNGGAFVHDAPWSTKEQGLRAVSHGCVNLAPAPAEAFYKLSQLGDVVNVVNAVVGPKLTDPGMMDWNLSWTAWLSGSANGATSA
jgi:lipoprotein-anchoring transpeptidase ErfK/SrfK